MMRGGTDCGRVKTSVEGEEAAALERAEVAGEALLVDVGGEHRGRLAHDARGHGLRQVEDEREPPPPSGSAGALALDGLPQLARARLKLRRADGRAGDREHQRRRVAEVLDEVDRARALRQVVDGVELHLDVVKVLARLL